jgi:hypothetical protein
MRALLVASFICFFSAVAMGSGDNNQWGAPEESPNFEEHSRTITACEDGGVPVVFCTVDIENRQECVVGCAYPSQESADE